MGGAKNGEVPDARDAVLETLTRDPDNPASVVACLARAREGAQAVRDVISAEMWEAINTTHLRLREGDLATPLASGPYSIHTHVKERSALFWGPTGRTMPRGEASAFLAAGGRIESADMCCGCCAWRCRRATPTTAPTARRSRQRYFGGARAGQSVRRPSMHFAIRFLTEYVYDAPVSDNLNALRGRPHTRMSIDVRARDVTAEPADPPEADWEAVTTEADVPPVRDVYQGTAGSKLDASVHTTRLDPQASARA